MPEPEPIGALVETSLAEAIARISAAESLPPQTRSHWLCSLRQIAKALDRLPTLVPARWTAICKPVERLHHARLGLTQKTLANHKANTRAALRWLAGDQDLPRRGIPLTPAWARLRKCVPDLNLRARLSGLLRFASAQGVSPPDLDDQVLAAYLRYRAETTALSSDIAATRSIARAWNRCVDTVEGWPAQRLSEPDLPVRQAGSSWEDLPLGLRADLTAYLDSLGRPRRTARGKRVRPSRPSTIRTRRAELLAFVRQAIAIGIPLEKLTSLGALLHPDVVEPVLEAYWQKNGAEPAIYTIELAWKLHAIARETGCLGADEGALLRLDDLRAELDSHRRVGMTDKNMRVIRQVLTSDVWREVLAVPGRLMKEAAEFGDHARVRAALRAQVAAAIAILTVAPVRLGNLARIRLEENLTRPAGPSSPYWLVFPDYDVKNRVRLEFPLDERVTALIETYVHEYRPILVRGSNEPWLFPGDGVANGGNGHKTPAMFSDQITEQVLKAVGLRITAHQFRHAAAAIILRHDPGNHEFVRRVLGHKSLQTTIRFYIGLETAQATERFGQIVRDQLRFAA